MSSKLISGVKVNSTEHKYSGTGDREIWVVISVISIFLLTQASY